MKKKGGDDGYILFLKSDRSGVQYDMTTEKRTRYLKYGKGEEHSQMLWGKYILSQLDFYMCPLNLTKSTAALALSPEINRPQDSTILFFFKEMKKKNPSQQAEANSVSTST